MSRLIEVIGSQGHFIPGSSISGTETNFPVRVAPGLGSERELRDLVLGRGADGQPLRLEALLDVRRGDDRLTRERSVLLAVEMKTGGTISRFDREVRAAVDGVVPALPAGVEVHTLSDQPASVKLRLSHFNRCFLEAVAVIMVVALLLMEWRAAVIVACAIPLTVAMTLAGMWALGIPLHQISITALIIALGMLVDDPVVAADGINRELAAGTPRCVAACRPWCCTSPTPPAAPPSLPPAPCPARRPGSAGSRGRKPLKRPRTGARSYPLDEPHLPSFTRT